MQSVLKISYAGIGSRKTPAETLEKMQRLGKRFAELGLVLRSGAADGADAAFEAGARLANGGCEIFLPWSKFNGHCSPLVATGQRAWNALEMASKSHPNWSNLSHASRKLHSRNCFQVFGFNLDDPVRFVLCWTEDGCESHIGRKSTTGGTGTAIALASMQGIPVFNMGRPGWMRRLEPLVLQLCQDRSDAQPLAA